MYPILTVTTFLPVVGAIAVLLLNERWARGIALGTTLATLFVSVPLYPNFDKTSSALQFVEVRSWIPSWNVTYGMGVDGISLPFIFSLGSDERAVCKCFLDCGPKNACVSFTRHCLWPRLQ